MTALNTQTTRHGVGLFYLASQFKLMKFKIVTPERVAVECEAASVLIPSAQGQIEVLPKHIAAVTALEPGEVIYTDAFKQSHTVICGGGFAEILGESVVIVTDAVYELGQLNESALEKAIASARNAMSGINSIDSEEARHLEEAVAYNTALLNLKRKRNSY